MLRFPIHVPPRAAPLPAPPCLLLGSARQGSWSRCAGQMRRAMPRVIMAVIVLISLGACETSKPAATPSVTPNPPTETAIPPTPTPIPLTQTPPPPPPPTSTPLPTPTATTVETALTSAASLGDAWTRPADGMEMMFVPPGTFQMGSSEAEIAVAISLCEQYPDDWGKCNETQRFENEAPQHTVTLDGFWIDRTEVTNAQYGLCVQAGACQRPRLAGSPAYNPANYPVAGVPWQQAANYCAWAGGRLPTEAEWEYAARGASGYLYPWGNTFDCQGGNFWDDDTGCGDGYSEPAPVGSFPTGASWCGGLDMAGNVWEWVADAYGEYDPADQTNPISPASGNERILRGGSWGYGPTFVRSTYRYPVPPTADYLAVGFRCAASSPTADTPSTEPTTTELSPTTALQEVTFGAEDGVDIAATLFGEGDIAVILLHMGTSGTNQKSWHPFAQSIADAGLAALTVDFRGRGKSGGSLVQDDLIEDARAAVGFLRNQGFERFVCMGASMGGTTCIRLAQEIELEGLVVISSANFSGDYRVAAEDLSLPIPKLFVYGSRDSFVPSFMAQMYHQASEPKEQIVYDSAAHGTDLFLTPYGDDFRQRLMGFLSKLDPTSTPAGITPGPSTTPEFNPDEAATLDSLEQVDDYPLYTMHYYGAYEQTEAGIERGQWLAEVKPNQGWPQACALFAALGDADNMLYGRNFDWRYSPALLLFTDPPDGYASVSMVDIEYLVGEDKADTLLDLPLAERQELLEAPFWPFDGMNEHGLAIGMAAVPPGQAPLDPDKETLDSLAVMREVLDHAKGADEAVAILQSYNIAMEGGPPLHYLVADPSGRALLLEFYQGETVIIPNEVPWHLATNFLRASAGESALGECWRYDRINYQLEQSNGQITAQEAMDILSQVSQDNTEWSVVYGMSTGDVTVIMGQKYDDGPHIFHLNLIREQGEAE